MVWRIVLMMHIAMMKVMKAICSLDTIVVTDCLPMKNTKSRTIYLKERLCTLYLVFTSCENKIMQLSRVVTGLNIILSN